MIAPTIVDVLRVPKPEWMSGESLLDDAARRPARPIFSLVDLAQMKVSGPQMKVLQDASPPFYGARSAAVVVCDQWVKHSFDSGAMTSGSFADHTAPCRDPSLSEYARSELEMHLAANGYLEKK